MNARFAPIVSPLPDLRKPGPCSPPPILEFARTQPDFGYPDMGEMGEHAQTYRPNLGILEEAMDDMAAYAEDRAPNLRPAKPADSDDVFSEDEDAEEVRELLAQRPTQPTPNGKWVGIAVDACALLQEVIEGNGTVSAARINKFEAVCARLRHQR